MIKTEPGLVWKVTFTIKPYDTMLLYIYDQNRARSRLKSYFYQKTLWYNITVDIYGKNRAWSCLKSHLYQKTKIRKTLWYNITVDIFGKNRHFKQTKIDI